MEGRLKETEMRGPLTALFLLMVDTHWQQHLMLPVRIRTGSPDVNSRLDHFSGAWKTKFNFVSTTPSEGICQVTRSVFREEHMLTNATNPRVGAA
jgi:hypothetical protein